MTEPKKWYNGDEYYEKFRRENPGMDLRERPPKWVMVDEYGNERNTDGGCLLIFGIMIVVFAILPHLLR